MLVHQTRHGGDMLHGRPLRALSSKKTDRSVQVNDTAEVCGERLGTFQEILMYLIAVKASGNYWTSPFCVN